MQEGHFPTSNLSPALPAEALRSRLLALDFSRRDISALFRQTEFLQIPYRSHQLCFLHDYARDVLDHPLRTADLAVLFEFNERTVRKNLARGPQEPGPLGRHAALTPEVEASLVEMLLEAFASGKSMTAKEFL
jgi:hypothetical protein